MQFSQILQGQFRGIYDLTFFENFQSVLEFLISLGEMIHSDQNIARLLSHNLQISLAATKNLFVNEDCNLRWFFFYRSVEP